jgi:hypothetical protein
MKKPLISEALYKAKLINNLEIILLNEITFVPLLKKKLLIYFHGFSILINNGKS